MIAIPFVFFLYLFVKYYKKNGLYSISTGLLGIYTVFSFFAILIDLTDSYSGICPYVDISIESPILYCGLLYLVIHPFLNIRETEIISVSSVKEYTYIDVVVYLYLFVFIGMVLLTYQDLFRNLQLLVLNDNLKADFRFGREEVLSITGFSLYLYNRLRILSFGSLNLIFLMFYSMAYRNKSMKYYIALILGSLSSVYDGILHIDRSIVVYWGMVFIMCLLMFYRNLDGSNKKIIKYTFGIFGGILLAYVAFINILRFSSGDMNSDSYLISYLGQSYVNFCTFVQKLELPEYSTIHVFPVYNNIVNPGYHGEDWHMYIEWRTGIFIMCFSTFVGEFISNMGIWWTILWCVAFSFICRRLLYRENPGEIKLSQYYLLFALLCMPYLGVFASYYHVPAREYTALLFYLVLRFSESKSIV